MKSNAGAGCGAAAGVANKAIGTDGKIEAKGAPRPVRTGAGLGRR